METTEMHKIRSSQVGYVAAITKDLNRVRYLSDGMTLTDLLCEAKIYCPEFQDAIAQDIRKVPAVHAGTLAETDFVTLPIVMTREVTLSGEVC